MRGCPSQLVCTRPNRGLPHTVANGPVRLERRLVPPVIAAVAVAAAAGAAGVAVGTATIGAAVFSVATTAAVSGLSYAMRPKGAAPAAATPQVAPANGERAVALRQATPSRRIAYGNVRTGGAVFFHENSNPQLYVGTVLSDGRIEAIDAVYFGDVAVPLDVNGTAINSGIFASRFALEKTGLGDATQAASPLLLGAFPSLVDADFRQRGCARAVARLHWGTDATQHGALWGGSVTPTYVIRGVRMYDPRQGAHVVTDPTTWAYSDNVALCVAHALMHAWDSPLAHTDIDWPSVAVAADACDVSVTVNGVVRKLFTLSGIFEAGTPIAPQISAMLAAMGGAVTFNNGKYSLHADTAKTSVWTVTDDDVYQVGDLSLDVETDSTFGIISAEYYSADDAGRRNTTPQYEADPLGRATALSLLFSATSHSAQVLAYRALQKSLAPRSLTLTVSDAGLYLLPHVDAIAIDSVAAPFLNGVYVVEQVDLTGTGAALKLREYAPTAYAAAPTYLQ
jgi:hypothetical protein